MLGSLLFETARLCVREYPFQRCVHLEEPEETAPRRCSDSHCCSGCWAVALKRMSQGGLESDVRGGGGERRQGRGVVVRSAGKEASGEDEGDGEGWRGVV